LANLPGFSAVSSKRMLCPLDSLGPVFRASRQSHTVSSSRHGQMLPDLKSHGWCEP